MKKTPKSDKKVAVLLKYVLGIEATAHTFGVGVASIDGSDIVDFSHQYIPEKGGIHPREASEHHSKVAPEILKKAIDYIKERGGDLVAIGFSQGPGLGPCLRVGATVARAIASYLDIPLFGIHHGVAHIEIGKKLTGAKDPLVVLVSGGHTMIVALEKGYYRVFGETLDISIGNLIDMFMRAAGYPSPAGALCEKLARESSDFVELPYIVKGTDLSFSGILTQAIKLLRKGVPVHTLCRSIQEVAFAMLTEVTERALVHTRKRELLIVGGVAANKRLREMLENICKEHNVTFYWSKKWNGDNGAMIAWTTVLAYKYGKPLRIEESLVKPLWRIDRVFIPWGSDQTS
ncbi:MAG: KEOPS complex N(6)-L-threonylcarbamoyladenine synthase Kae1 [Candidatus Njordarchaeales archaeon]